MLLPVPKTLANIKVLGAPIYMKAVRDFLNPFLSLRLWKIISCPYEKAFQHHDLQKVFLRYSQIIISYLDLLVNRYMTDVLILLCKDS